VPVGGVAGSALQRSRLAVGSSPASPVGKEIGPKVEQ